MKGREKKSIHSSKLPTSGRIGRIVKKMLSKVGLFKTEKVMKDADSFDGLSQPAKAEYVREMVIRMKRTIGPKQSREILASCGSMCCGKTTRKAAVKAMHKSKSLDDFLQELNKLHIGGGRLKLKDRHTITGGYNRCYCGMVNKTRTPFSDLTFCYCSSGWYRQLFETALEKPVRVTIKKSIVCGDKTCEFEIKIERK